MSEFDSNYVPEDIEKGEEAIVCPICGTSVINNPADLLFQVDHFDSDFRVCTLEDDVLDDWLLMCPSCYYIDHDFKQPPLRENEIRAYVESEEYLRLFSDNTPTTLEKFSIYLILLTLQGRDAYARADCHHRLAWLYEDEDSAEKADLHRNKAIEFFGKSFLERFFDVRQTGLIYYKMADLYRRMGGFDSAGQMLYNMDMKEKTLKHLFDFQSKLLAEKNSGRVALPGENGSEL